MYQALYRKYRPKSFDEIFGQDSIVETLKNAISNNKLSHAYLFCGPRGTGKTSVAKIIAKTVNCEKLKDATPCNKCVNCTQNIIDIIEIDAASNNGVDEIRDLKNKISLVPTYGKYKIYIIDEVHMLTISAFNALLKTLEEPPKHIIFILATTDPQKVPLTIISRCQRFDFRRIDDKSILKRLEEICKLEKIKIEEEALKEIARISDGGLRDAVNLLDQAYSYSEGTITIENIHEINGTLTQYEIASFYEDYIEKKLDSILKKIDEYNRVGKNLVKLAQEFIVFLRNTIVHEQAPVYLNEQGIDITPYEKISVKLKKDTIMNLIKDLNVTINDMKISQNPKLLFELLFIKNINNDEQPVTPLEVPVQTEKKDQNPKKNISREIIVEDEQKEIEKKISNEVVTNIEIIKNIRIENTLARFSKPKLVELKKDIEKIKPMLIDGKYSQFVSLILDGSIRAASDKNLIFMYEIDSDAEMFNSNLPLLEEITMKGLEHDYKLIAVNKSEWNKIKQEFNNHLKQYEYKEEPKLINEKKEVKNVKKIFEDIIEYR